MSSSAGILANDEKAIDDWRRAHTPDAVAEKPRFPNSTLVHLRSGSPGMMVEKTRPDGWVQCVWFDGAIARRDAFREDALTTALKSIYARL